MPADMEYFKVACPHCASHLEFASEAEGTELPCPHCSRPIALQAGSRAGSNKPHSHIFPVFVAGILSGALVIGIVLLILHARHPINPSLQCYDVLQTDISNVATHFQAGLHQPDLVRYAPFTNSVEQLRLDFEVHSKGLDSDSRESVETLLMMLDNTEVSSRLFLYLMSENQMDQADPVLKNYATSLQDLAKRDHHTGHNFFEHTVSLLETHRPTT